MKLRVNYLDLRTSWTKYDIVRVMEVVENLEILKKFLNKEAEIDEPILRSFLGVNSLHDPLPDHWIQIQKYPKEKKLFAFLATMFTHGEIVQDFAFKYSTGNMEGIFVTGKGKQYTNIRSALIESGAAQPIFRRTKEVPYDFSIVFNNPTVGKLFKSLLIERISRLTTIELNNEEFYQICFDNNFEKALSISKERFISWTQGVESDNSGQNHFINKVEIENFFCVEQAILDFENSKEIYLLGENGDGKSLILMAIYLAFNGTHIIENSDQEKTGKVSDIIKTNKDVFLRGFDENQTEYNLNRNNYLKNLFAYGTHRGRYSTDTPEEYGFMSLFDSEETLVNPVSWLKDQKLFELEKSLDAQNSFGETKILPNSFSVLSLEKMFYELLEKHVKIKIEGNGVLFIEKGTHLTFDQLSEGYKIIIIFVSDLIYRLNKTETKNINISDLRGIVLVDEIDLHLHPKWQRVIVSKLRKLLPNVQFIFTTHSPTIIQGASDEAIIYRVYRNSEDGKTKLSDKYYRRDLDHLMINTILTSPLFGLEDSRMNSQDDDADTSKTYLLYRIKKKLEAELEKQKIEGKEFVNDEEVDRIIQQIINKELGTQ